MSICITTDSSQCISCGECSRECHRHLPVSRRADMSSDNVECIHCFHCYAVCPHQAIALTGMTSALQEDTEECSTIDEDQLLHFLAFRRSVRRFKTQEVERGVIEKLIHAAGYIPSRGNSHPYKFTLIPTPGEDSMLAAYNIVLMAQAMGLGSCFVSLARNAINASRKCRKILKLGSADRIHAVVVLGYPAVKFQRAIPRESKPFQGLKTR